MGSPLLQEYIMDSPFEDLGLQIEEVTPSTGMAMVIHAQTRYAAYCKLLAEASIESAVPAAKKYCRDTFIAIADEIYNRIPEDQR
jgi:hypothetical protein